ncbi:MAG TPA: acyltransferase [Acidimicrobiales bacterium]|nr:acyltransferase [Acidimicrobiales bacterium]
MAPSWFSDAPPAFTQEDPGLPGFAAFGECSVLHRPVTSIVNPGGVAIGSWVSIGSGAVIEALVPERGVTVTIDDGAYIGHGLRLTAVGEVVIGAEAMLADGCYVSDTNHIYEDVTEPIKRQGLREGRRVEIGPGAWLGIGAVVCGNVRVGRNAVIGARSVVTSDVPDFCVVAGNPARIVRRWDGDRWDWLPDGGEPLR